MPCVSGVLARALHIHLDMETTFKVIESATGCHLRDATPEEIELYHQGEKAACGGAVRISATESVYEYTGPGVWHGGAGF